MQNILVTGSNGQLGQAVKLSAGRMLDFNFYYTDVDELDITSYENIDRFIKQNKINCIVNCAAYTTVDKAESEREKAFLINVEAVEHLAKLAKLNDALLVHISTDYIFDGTSKQPYTENDIANPGSYYGFTKYQAEQKIKEFANRAVIIRTSWLYSEFGNNFVKTMIRLGNERDNINVVNDQFGSPTYAPDLADVILKIIQTKINGIHIYHYSNEGHCTWYEFAKAIMEIKNISCLIKPIKTEEYPTAAKRPQYSLLDKSKIKKELKISIPYWKDSLKICLKNIG